MPAGYSVDAIAGLCRAGVTFGIALAFALGAPAAATAATIDVDETQESATFVNGGATPADYYDSIKDPSNHNGKCSLREAIRASNTDAKVDGCAAGDGPGDVVDVAGRAVPRVRHLIVLERVTIRGANAGDPATTRTAARRRRSRWTTTRTPSPSRRCSGSVSPRQTDPREAAAPSSRG